MELSEKKFLKKNFQKLLDLSIDLQTLENNDGWNYLMAHSECFYSKWNINIPNYIQLIGLEKIVSEYCLNFKSSDKYLLNTIEQRIKHIKVDLLELNYSIKWLETNILTIPILKEQIEEFNKGKDLNTEHYRYKVLKNYIESKEKFTNIEIKNIIDLTLTDKDTSMSSSVLIELFRKDNLTEKQFNDIKIALKSFGEWTNKVIERQIKKTKF